MKIYVHISTFAFFPKISFTKSPPKVQFLGGHEPEEVKQENYKKVSMPPPKDQK